jgi:hypothetical protein
MAISRRTFVAAALATIGRPPALWPPRLDPEGYANNGADAPRSNREGSYASLAGGYAATCPHHERQSGMQVPSIVLDWEEIIIKARIKTGRIPS